MGNTPSTPPALVSVNAGGNEILVPTGTSLYACPPPTPGGYHPPYSYGPREARGPVYRLVDSPYDRTRPRRKKHGRAEVDLNIREYEEESESTDLGELPEPMKMRKKGSKTSDTRMPGGRRVVPVPYDTDLRPRGVPVEYMGMRGGQGHPGMYPEMEEPGFDSNMVQMRPGMHPTMPCLLPHPGVLPLPTLPPRYVSREPKLPFPGGVGMNPYAPCSLQPPPSTGSPPPGPESGSNRLPPGVQAAIDAAVQRSADLAGKSKLQTSQSNPSPAGLAKKDSGALNNGWGGRIDTCVCTTKCKCRKGERSTGWYEGVADIDGEKIPMRGKLNARWIFSNDLGKNCGVHRERRKSSDSSSDDTETSSSKHTKKNKSRRRAKKEKNTENGKLDQIKSETDKAMKALPLGQRLRYPPPPLVGTDFSFDVKDTREPDPAMLKQMERLRIEAGANPYGTGRIGGVEALGRLQGTFDPMTRRNIHSAQMQPKAFGLRSRLEGEGFMENYEGMGGTGLGNLYARPKVRSAKGRNRNPLQSKGQTSIRFRGSLSQPDKEPRITFRRGVGRGTGDTLANYQVRGGRFHPRFEPDDSEFNLRPRRRIGTKALGGNEDGEIVTYQLLKQSAGDEDKGALPWSERPRTGPPGGKNDLSSEQADSRQAYAETDDDEDY